MRRAVALTRRTGPSARPPSSRPPTPASNRTAREARIRIWRTCCRVASTASSVSPTWITPIGRPSADSGFVSSRIVRSPLNGRLASISRPSRAAMTSSGSIGSWLPELPTSSARWSRTWTDRSGPTASSTVTGPSWPGARSADSSKPSGPGERLRPIWAARKRRASSTCRSRLARRTMYSKLPKASRLRPSRAPYQSTRRKRSDGATEKRSPRRPVTPAPDRPILHPSRRA